MKRSVIPLFFVLSILFCSCAEKSPNQETLAQIHPEQRLHITARYQKGPEGYAYFTSEELGGNLGDSLEYMRLTDVNITLEESVYPLEDAIKNGLLSVEEIFAYARLDARNGFCNETHKTKNGLTHFTYHYEGIDLCLVYDVYETPSGQPHLINDIGVYHDGTEVYHMYTDDKTGERLDYEDWGLNFTVSDISPTGVTILCQQSGGQQIGTLCIDNAWHMIEVEEKSPTAEVQPSPEIPLAMEGESTFSLDWTEKYGALPSGNYELVLCVNDHFDESQVHPLMKDFQQRQYYSIELTLP